VNTNLYEQAPNGGVLVVKVFSTALENFKPPPPPLDCNSEEECRKMEEMRKQEEIAKEKARIEEEIRCARWGCPPPIPEKIPRLFDFERLIFLEPKSTLPFTISTE
jgi:hypothetical protein